MISPIDVAEDSTSRSDREHQESLETPVNVVSEPTQVSGDKFVIQLTPEKEENEVVSTARSIIANREFVASEVSFRRRTCSLPAKIADGENLIKPQKMGQRSSSLSALLEDTNGESWDNERFKCYQSDTNSLEVDEILNSDLGDSRQQKEQVLSQHGNDLTSGEVASDQVKCGAASADINNEPEDTMQQKVQAIAQGDNELTPEEAVSDQVTCGEIFDDDKVDPEQLDLEIKCRTQNKLYGIFLGPMNKKRKISPTAQTPGDKSIKLGDQLCASPDLRPGKCTARGRVNSDCPDTRR